MPCRSLNLLVVPLFLSIPTEAMWSSPVHWKLKNSIGHASSEFLDVCSSPQRLTLWSVLYNNLGGLGPDLNRPEGILFGDVFPGSEVTIDLLIEAGPDTGAMPYFPNNSASNGFRGRRGTLNIQAGSSIELQFSFLNRQTKNPTVPKPFLLSFIDLEEKDKVAVPAAVDYSLSEESQVVAMEASGSGSLTYFGPTAAQSSDGMMLDTDVDSLLLTPNRLSRSITFTMSGVSQFMVSIGNSADGNFGRTFLIDGPTQLACSAADSCARYPCPVGFVRKSEAEKLSCNTMPCDTTDYLNCCDRVFEDPCRRDAHITFTQSHLIRSNLNGQGPTCSPKQDILIDDVFPESGRRVDAVLTVDSAYMAGKAVDNTILSEGWLAMSFAAGQAIELSVRFVGRGDQPVQVDPMHIVAQFVSNTRGDSNATLVGVGSVQHNLTSNTRLTGQTMGVDGGSKITFPHNTESRPSALFQLPKAVLPWTVSFLFPRSNGLTFRVMTPPGGAFDYWTLRLAGASNMVCPSRPTCSSFTCPSTYVTKADHGNVECSGPRCTDADISVCCSLVDIPPCTDELSMQLLPSSLVTSNLGGLGPDRHAHEGLTFGNVFPGCGTTMDLDVTVDDRYETYGSNANGLWNGWGKITMKPGLTINLTFTLFDRATKQRTAPTAPWYFTFLSQSSRDETEAEGTYGASEPMHVVKFDPAAMRHVISSSGQVVVNRGEFRAPGVGSGADILNPRSLSNSQTQRAVTVLIPTESQFTMEITSSAIGNASFLFGGSSSLVCPKRALCSSFTCPTSYVANPQASSRVCHGQVCDAVDVNLCCTDAEDSICGLSHQLTFKENNVLYSNLGGFGPDFESPEEIVVQDVFPFSGDIIDLVITAPGDYTPAKSSLNGVTGGLLWINAHTGTENDLVFQFKRRNGDLATMWPYGLSIFDFDMQKNGQAVESVMIGEPSYWRTDVNTSINVTRVSARRLDRDLDGHALLLTATQVGTGSGNPRNALALTPEQMANSVSMVTSARTLKANFAIGQGYNSGRNMMIGGASNILCERRALCSEYVCPIGYRAAEGSENHVCQSKECSDQDKDICCEKMVEPGCEANMEMVFDNVIYSNLGKEGPDTYKPEGIVFGNVFPTWPQDIVVDLNITTARNSEYHVSDTSLNGVIRGYGTIAMSAGSETLFNFNFTDRASGEPVVPPVFQLIAAGLKTDELGGAAQTVQMVSAPIYMNTTASSQLRLDPDSRTASGATQLTALYPMAMSMPPWLADNSVSFTFAGVSSLQVQLASSAGTGDTVFSLGGPSNIMCPERELCNVFQCPVGMKQKRNAGLISCADVVCDSIDTTTCCEWQLSEGCDDDVSFELVTSSLFVNNLGGNGPDRDGPEALVIGNVMPRSGKTIDAVIKTLDDASANLVSSRNAILYGELQIVTKGVGTVRLAMEFRDRQTNEPVKVPPFFLSMFDMYADDNGFVKVVNFNKVAVAKVYKRGRVHVRENGAFVGLNSTNSTEQEASSSDIGTGGNFLGLPQSRLARSASVLVKPTGSLEFNLTIEAWGAHCDKLEPHARVTTFRIGGRTNLVCPKKASCANFACPAGHLQKRHPQTRHCRGPKCTDRDMPTCCKKEDLDDACASRNRLVLNTGSLIHSNLAGLGPNLSQPQSLLFGNVFPHHYGGPVDMEFVADEQYKPAKSEKNGLDGSWARINLWTGSAAHMKVRFIDRTTGLEKAVGPWHMTVLDLDQQSDGRGQESVWVPTGYLQAVTTPSSEVVRDSGLFLSSGYGSKEDNVNALALTPGQLARTVSFLMPRASNFNLSMSTSPGWNSGRNFFLGGASNMVCKSHATCTNYTCPAGWTAKEGQADLVCDDDVCSDIDRTNCCDAVPVEGCDPNDVMMLGLNSLFYSNLGGQGPDIGSPPGMLFGHVFPLKKDIIDLMVVAVGDYTAVKPELNRMYGVFAGINTVCNTTVETMFQFVDRVTGKPAVLTAPVIVTLFDFNKDGTSMTTPEVEIISSDAVEVTSGSGVRAKDPANLRFHEPAKTLKKSRRYRSFRSARWRRENETLPDHPLKAGLSTGDDPVLSMMFAAGQSSFNIKFRAWLEDSTNCQGRTFYFGGASSLVCPARETCADYVCPSGYTSKPGVEGQVCSGLFCTPSDIATCCDLPKTTLTTTTVPASTTTDSSSGSSSNPPCTVAGSSE